MSQTQLYEKDRGFYPTPPEFAETLVASLDLDYIATVLEPSAGKGNLAHATRRAMKARCGYGRDYEPDIDCIEIDRHLRHILRGEGYRVVAEDFLRFRGGKRYDLIIMNPPFDAGDAHLLKALEMQENGGNILCILNAETLRNPYTFRRQALIKLLNKHEARIEYHQNVFSRAERPSDVEIAVVKVTIEREEFHSDIFERMTAAKEKRFAEQECADVAAGDFLDSAIKMYEIAAASMEKLVDEFRGLVPRMYNDLDPENRFRQPILHICLNDSNCYRDDANYNIALRELRKSYWRWLFQRKEFTGKLTSNLQKRYGEMVDKMADYDFSRFNIDTIRVEINAEIITGIEENIMSLFDKLTQEHSWYPECKKNIHYYNGWKTNKAHKIGKKAIIPTYGVWDSWSGKLDVYEASKFFADIEKTLNYLDGGLTDDISIDNAIKEARETGVTRNIHCKYFDLDIFKKGTAHIKFRDLRLLDRLNIYAARNRKWLPPNYGAARYDDMPPEEQAVVDSFQGKDAYEEVLREARYYLQPVVAGMLTEG